MSDRLDSEGAGLPPEMGELEAELDSIRYEERPSFAPELKAELAREWVRFRYRRRRDFRPLLAAGIAALLLVAVGVPSARAALVKLVDVVQTRVTQGATAKPRPRTVRPAPVEKAARVPSEARQGPVEAPEPPETKKAKAYDGPAATLPRLIDRAGVEALIRRYYPVDLQRAGIGGVVGLQLWVDSTGAVDVVNLAKGSGYGRLDRAALKVAPTFRFVPARRRGQAVGTWVQFDVRFRVPSEDSLSAFGNGDSGSGDGGSAGDAADVDVPTWQGTLALPMPIDNEAGELLRKAIGDDVLIRRLGPIDAILDGEPPAGVQPTAWRTQVGDALEQAITRDPDNPAPFLALARLRRRQGLRKEARLLFERGLERAQHAPAGSSPAILSELEYERGTLVREKWLTARDLGRLPADALSPDQCPQAHSSGDATVGYVPVAQLIAWNYTCPAQLGHAMQAAFESTGSHDADADYIMMMASFRAAVEAYPAHVGANVELLLELADEWRWDDVLEGAQRFVDASGGHPYGLLLEGIALQRLGRSEEAQDRFRLAFRDLPADEAAELQDPSALMTPRQLAQYRALEGSKRATWLRAFWAGLDPILTTPVNEREVEHYTRTAYALLRFGSAASDPGRVWVRYGRPNEVRVVSDGSGVRTEFWDYGSAAPAVTFRRMASSETLHLTSEGKAYLDDLSRVFPQRYGADSRTVSPLAGQVSRFRAGRRSVSLVRVNTEVPAGFATGDRDTLDVGVFLLGADGEKLRSAVRKVPATEAPLSQVLTAGPEVRTIAVEFFHPRLGQAATLRERAHGHEGDPGIGFSDVMVVHAAHPEPQDVRPDAPWVVPYTLGQPVAEDSVGLLFEYYGLQAVAEYRLHVQLQDRSTGRIREVPIKPAGLDGFQTIWDRAPAPEGPTREYVTADLTGVPAGRYVLKVIADLPEADRALVMARDFDRR